MCLSAAGCVLTIDPGRHEADVDVDGTTRTVSLAVLTLDGRHVTPGDWVLVHTGFAVDVLEEGAVADLLALREEMREEMREGGRRA